MPRKPSITRDDARSPILTILSIMVVAAGVGIISFITQATYATGSVGVSTTNAAFSAADSTSTTVACYGDQ